MKTKLKSIVDDSDDEQHENAAAEADFEPATNTVLWDLNIRIEGNPVYHAFSASLEKCSSRSIRLGKTDVTKIISETGKVAVICQNRKSTGYLAETFEMKMTLIINQ